MLLHTALDAFCGSIHPLVKQEIGALLPLAPANLPGLTAFRGITPDDDLFLGDFLDGFVVEVEPARRVLTEDGGGVVPARC